MIRVEPVVSEPPDFDEMVRRPGVAALTQMVGRVPGRSQRRGVRPPLAQRCEDIPSTSFPPLWRESREDLAVAYHGVCAYSAMRIGKAKKCGTVDHFIPISADWRGAYEWSNFRLACTEANTWKGIHQLPFDPFGLPPRLCALEFVAFQVIPGEGAHGTNVALVDHMINKQLRLNERIFREAREEYFNDYQFRGFPLHLLERDAPFIAMELRRQGMLRDGDA